MSFDLDAVLGLPFVFTFGGQEYTLPPDVDFTTIDLLQDSKPDEAFRRLLGEDQWERLVAAPEVFGAKSFSAVLDAYMKHLGLRQGESPASPPSSANTAEPSRPTSSGTTESRSPGSVTVRTG